MEKEPDGQGGRPTPWLSRVRDWRVDLCVAGGIVAIGAAVVFWISAPQAFEAWTRSRVSYVKSTMRSMAVALEAYHVDNNAYPIIAPMRGIGGEPAPVAPWPLTMPFPGGRPSDWGVTTATTKVFGLTSPIAYMTQMPQDVTFEERTQWRGPFEIGSRFAWPFERAALWYDEVVLGKEWLTPFPFAYYTDGPGWILMSTGPDRDYDVDPRVDYDGAAKTPLPGLVLKTYDPTNGTKSDGDVWRVKE